MVSQRLDRHIQRTANEVVFSENCKLLKLVSKSEIAEFAYPVLQQNVRRFYISMHYAVFGQISASQPHSVRNFCPIEALVAVDEGLQRATLTVFSDDIIIVARVVKIHKLDYIGMLYQLQNPNLVLQHIASVFLHLHNFDNFQRHQLSVVVILVTAVDHAAKAAADHIGQTVTIGANSFPAWQNLGSLLGRGAFDGRLNGIFLYNWAVLRISSSSFGDNLSHL